MDVQTAQIEINKILRQLEHSSGCVVEDVSLQKLDTTAVADTFQVLQVSVVIELKRLPSQNWSV